MSTSHSLLVLLTTYKIVTIFTGLAFAFMGYKLFIHGIFVHAGELNTEWNDKRLVLKKAMPGTFFALLGTIIVCVSLWRGLTFGPIVADGGEMRAGGGSGFIPGASTSSGVDANKVRSDVIEDVGILNQFASALEIQSNKDEASQLTFPVEDGNRISDLILRTKATLILSVWSSDWGDRDEFIKWARKDDGYFYSEPPNDIIRPATIFLGVTQ